MSRVWRSWRMTMSLFGIAVLFCISVGAFLARATRLRGAISRLLAIVKSTGRTMACVSPLGQHRMRVRRCIAATAPLLALGLSGCLSSSGDGPIPLARVDMARMYGGWYLIATRRNWFEKGIVGPYDVYSKRADGDIQEDFYVRTKSFQAPLKHFTIHDWVRPGTNNAHWRVQVLWPINLPFFVLYVDPDYRYVMFGENNRKLGWIYARTPTISETDYQSLLARFKALGYDTSTFVRFVQTPDQIGKPGIWSDGIHR